MLQYPLESKFSLTSVFCIDDTSVSGLLLNFESSVELFISLFSDFLLSLKSFPPFKFKQLVDGTLLTTKCSTSVGLCDGVRGNAFPERYVASNLLLPSNENKK